MKSFFYFRTRLATSLSLSERRFHHNSFQFASTHINAYFGTHLTKFWFHITKTNTYLACRRHGSRSYHTHRFAFGIEQGIAMTRYSSVNHFKAYKFTRNAFCLLLRQESTIHEVFAIDKLRYPTKAGLYGRCSVVQIVSIQTEAHLQAECIASTQAYFIL